MSVYATVRASQRETRCAIERQQERAQRRAAFQASLDPSASLRIYGCTLEPHVNPELHAATESMQSFVPLNGVGSDDNLVERFDGRVLLDEAVMKKTTTTAAKQSKSDTEVGVVHVASLPDVRLVRRRRRRRKRRRRRRTGRRRRRRTERRRRRRAGRGGGRGEGGGGGE
jgi:hypothetical protein